MAQPPGSDAAAVVPALRRLLLGLLALGLAATALDLYLLGHYEDAWQFAPFAAIGLGLAAVTWHAVGGGAASVRAVQGAMLICLVSGAIGVVLHYQGNMAFQIDIDPSIGGWDLFRKVVRAKAPPAMAPGAMAQLGLLGLVVTYRHPALRGGPPSSASSSPGA